ncbi:MAG: aspartate dehydrogenase [Oscillospiraceae bacterium]|nr:aspartate dehydrogenase [Oscillospiraceae bacterium]
MSWFRRKPKAPLYDPEKQQPAVRRSYCNREMSLGFLDKQTGKFVEHRGATTQQELEAFCRQYGIRPEDLKTIY